MLQEKKGVPSAQMPDRRAERSRRLRKGTMCLVARDSLVYLNFLHVLFLFS